MDVVSLDLPAVSSPSDTLPSMLTAKQSRHGLIRKTQTDLDIFGDYWLISEHKQANK